MTYRDILPTATAIGGACARARVGVDGGIFQMENGGNDMAGKPTTDKPTARTRQAVKPTTDKPTAVPDATAAIRNAVAGINGTDRTAIVARIKAYSGNIRENSRLLLADVLTLCAGIPAKEWKDTLMPEIGAQRVGKVLTRDDCRTLVKELRDPARNGGRVTTEDVASVLGIGVGTVNRHEKATDEIDTGESDGTADGNGRKDGKSGVEMLARIEADLQKALAKDDARSEEFIARLNLLLVTARKGLPSGIDTNNRGGKS